MAARNGETDVHSAKHLTKAKKNNRLPHKKAVNLSSAVYSFYHENPVLPINQFGSSNNNSALADELPASAASRKHSMALRLLAVTP